MLARTSIFALIFATLGTAACSLETEGSDNEFAEVPAYQDGFGAVSDDGNFKVMLFSEDGDVAEGENTFFVRVGHAVEGNPLNEGAAVDDASVSIDAVGESDEQSFGSDRIALMGDGTYMVEKIELEGGVWQLDVTIEASGIEDQVTFFFTVD